MRQEVGGGSGGGGPTVGGGDVQSAGEGGRESSAEGGGETIADYACQLSVTQPPLPPWGLIPWLLSLRMIPRVVRSNPFLLLCTPWHKRSFRSDMSAMQGLLYTTLCCFAC